MSDRDFKRGDLLRVRTADGRWLTRKAVSGPEGGEQHDFPIVWITFAHADPTTTRDVWPWPEEDVFHLREVPA